MATVKLDCTDERARCRLCGFSTACKNAVWHKCKAMGLGDLVAAGLAAIGITEERVSAAIGRPCGCGERREKLNELGRQIGLG